MGNFKILNPSISFKTQILFSCKMGLFLSFFAWTSRRHDLCLFICISLNCRYIDSAGLSGPLPSSFSGLTRMTMLYAYKRCFVNNVIPCDSILYVIFLCLGGHQIMILLGKYQIILGAGLI